MGQKNGSLDYVLGLSLKEALVLQSTVAWIISVLVKFFFLHVCFR